MPRLASLKLALVGSAFTLATAGAAGKTTLSALDCPYKLVAYRKVKDRAYGLATKLGESTPSAVVPVDFLAPDTSASEIFSTATAAKLRRFACELAANPKRAAKLQLPVAASEVLPPLPQPQNIVAIGLNYAAHNDEVDIDEAVLFPKNVALSGAYADISRPQGSLLDWEVELAYVVRKEIPRDTELTEANVAEYIAGYVLANDVTDRIPIIRDLDTGFTKGKTQPSFLPVGPFFVPIESFPAGRRLNPALPMSLTVNGANKQSANTAEMLQQLPAIVKLAYARAGTTWEHADGRRSPLLATPNFVAGDLLITGTPGGTAIVAPGLKQKLGLALKGLLRVQNPKLVFITEEYCSGKYLRGGDVVSAGIADLGLQRNLVVESDAGEPKVACSRRPEVSRLLQR